MELDFSTIAPRLRTVGLHITQEEQDIVDAAFPWLLHEYRLDHIQYFGKIFTVLPQPYLVIRGFREGSGTPVFLVTLGGIDWTELPAPDDKIIEALESINYGLLCQHPFTGKLHELLPRPEGEPEEEEEPEEEAEEKGEDEEKEEGEEGDEEKTKKEPKPKKEKPLKPTEAHRLALNITEIQNGLQLIIPVAYSKKGSQPVRNASFRGLMNPSSSDIAVKSEYLAFLENSYSGGMGACPTIATYPYSFTYPSRFCPENNCLLVSNRFWPGARYYVFSGTLIWGSAYEGTGLMDIAAHTTQ